MVHLLMLLKSKKFPMILLSSNSMKKCLFFLLQRGLRPTPSTLLMSFNYKDEKKIYAGTVLALEFVNIGLYFFTVSFASISATFEAIS